jgi:hypothetical protein
VFWTGPNGGFVITLSSNGFETMTTDEIARHRLELRVREIAEQLSLYQSVTFSTGYVEDVEEWRKAARIAGRRLKIQVRTGVSPDGEKVWASEGP